MKRNRLGLLTAAFVALITLSAEPFAHSVGRCNWQIFPLVNLIVNLNLLRISNSKRITIWDHPLRQEIIDLSLCLGSKHHLLPRNPIRPESLRLPAKKVSANFPFPPFATGFSCFSRSLVSPVAGGWCWCWCLASTSPLSSPTGSLLPQKGRGRAHRSPSRRGGVRLEIHDRCP